MGGEEWNGPLIAFIYFFSHTSFIYPPTIFAFIFHCGFNFLKTEFSQLQGVSLVHIQDFKSSFFI